MGPRDVVFHELDVVIKFNKEDLANDLIHLRHYSWPLMGMTTSRSVSQVRECP